MYDNFDNDKIQYKNSDATEAIMTKLKKRAVWGLLIWGVAIITAYIIFFIGGGPKTFLDGDLRVALTRTVFTAGFICYFLMLYLSRTKSGSKEIVTDETGFLVKPKSSSELSTLISGLGSQDLDSMGRAARKRIEKNFTWDNTVRSLIKVFRNG